MSYEKKMKELLGRLVAMSPEPPPYPEEMTMATEQSPKRPRPALVFVGAALLVAALAVPVILLTADDAPVGVGTTTTTVTPASSTTTTPVESTTVTTVPETTTTTVPVASEWSGTVFLYQAPENSFKADPALVPLTLQVTDLTGSLRPGDMFTSALTALGAGLPDGFENAIPGDVEIVGLSTTETGDVLADMNEAFLDGAGGLLADFTMLNQLIYTLTFADPDQEVLFTVNGEPVEAFGSDGLVLTSLVGRDSFQEELALIYLTVPVADDGGEYLVEGLANAYEASLWVNVLDADGTVVHEEYVMALCGTGCWGEFSATIDAGLIVPGESSIRAFTYSAEDGSISDAITVPIPEGEIWELVIG